MSCLPVILTGSASGHLCTETAGAPIGIKPKITHFLKETCGHSARFDL